MNSSFPQRPLQAGDKIRAKDGSGNMIIKKTDRVGVWGVLLYATGKVGEGAITWQQLGKDWQFIDLS